MSQTSIRFKVLDLVTGKIITDSSAYNAVVERHNGIGTVALEHDRALALPWTGENAVDGTPIFAEDVVAAIVDGEETTDVVTWADAAWRFGNYEGTIADYVISHVLGSRHEIQWPVEA